MITVPNYFTYDQRLMIKDAAELANMKVLQLVHENTAAAVMFAIDQKIEHEKNLTVLFYNMGGMDTEVSVIRYSMLNQSEKKSSPHIEIVSESSDAEMGSKDIELVIVEILADTFNAMPERKGKEDVRKNVRAIKRIFKEALRTKEILTANKAASVKIPELLDYVTLKFELTREELESKLTQFLGRVTAPIDVALAEAGLTVDEID